MDYDHPGSTYLVNPTNGDWAFVNSNPEYLGDGYGVPVSKSYIASRKVAVVLFCGEDMGDAFDLHYLRLTYQYAVLK